MIHANETELDSEGASESGEMVCPDCGSQQIDTGYPDFQGVCSDCGFVLAVDGDHTVRERPAPTTEDESASVASDNPDDWDQEYKVSNSTEQSVADGFSHLEVLGEELGLSKPLRRRAAEIYAEAAVSNLVDGRRKETVVAAAVLISSRESDTPYPLAVIAEKVGIEKSGLNRIIRELYSQPSISTSQST